MIPLLNWRLEIEIPRDWSWFLLVLYSRSLLGKNFLSKSLYFWNSQEKWQTVLSTSLQLEYHEVLNETTNLTFSLQILFFIQWSLMEWFPWMLCSWNICLVLCPPLRFWRLHNLAVFFEVLFSVSTPFLFLIRQSKSSAVGESRAY